MENFHSIDCPIPWCAGDSATHGDDGAPPELWMHGDDGTDLPHGARLYRYQGGTGAPEYELWFPPGAFAYGDALPAAASKLRHIADALEVLSGA